VDAIDAWRVSKYEAAARLGFRAKECQFNKERRRCVLFKVRLSCRWRMGRPFARMGGQAFRLRPSCAARGPESPLAVSIPGGVAALPALQLCLYRSARGVSGFGALVSPCDENVI